MPTDNPHVTDLDRVLDGITGAIADGVYGPGDRLPSIRDLAQMYGVGQTTVKNALAMLKRTGAIRTHPGKGTFVPGGGAGAGGCDPPEGPGS